MSSLFDFDQKTDNYAVMGNPISHSKSPRIHQLFATQCAQNLEYTAIQVDVGGFEQAVGNFFANGGKGLNVTVPFKREAWEIAAIRSERAQLAGAINTLLTNSEGQIYGDNTDGAGLVNDLCKNHRLDLTGRRILLLGAGGAARGVLQPLLNTLPKKLIIANRSTDRALDLVTLFKDLGPLDASPYDELDGQQFDIIINATSASLHGALPPISKSVLRASTVCYDMMYGTEETAFVAWSRKHGTEKAIDGLGMLVEQAAESFYLWRGVRPDTAPVINQLRMEI